eukprot:scaffold6579_cov55-Cyclotella_meneghiniana.AAC.4
MRNEKALGRTKRLTVDTYLERESVGIFSVHHSHSVDFLATRTNEKSKMQVGSLRGLTCAAPARIEMVLGTGYADNLRIPVEYLSAGLTLSMIDPSQGADSEAQKMAHHSMIALPVSQTGSNHPTYSCLPHPNILPPRYSAMNNQAGPTQCQNRTEQNRTT